MVIQEIWGFIFFSTLQRRHISCHKSLSSHLWENDSLLQACLTPVHQW